MLLRFGHVCTREVAMAPGIKLARQGGGLVDFGHGVDGPFAAPLNEVEIIDVPAHDEIGWGQRAFEAACIAGAAVLICIHAGRLISVKDHWSWPLIAAIATGGLFADFMSGMIHWFADTWFHETMPILGRRLLRPFRVHHVNPADFLRRSFIDTNGDVSMVCILFLLAIYACPLESAAGLWWAVFLFSSTIVAWPTNQVHQWAHMQHPPRLAGWLQRAGIILDGPSHRLHHRLPYTEYYCIATGWLNRPLTAIQFFRRLEALITWLTGLEPREDDTKFIELARDRQVKRRGV
jgi:plasmanylethanolamine desaturase